MPPPSVLLLCGAAGALATYMLYLVHEAGWSFWMVLLVHSAAYAAIGAVGGSVGVRRVMVPRRGRARGLERRYRTDPGLIGAAIVLPLPLVVAWIEKFTLLGLLLGTLFVPPLWLPAAAGAWIGGKIRIAASDTMARVDGER